MQAVLKPLDVQQTKDLETTVAGLRADKTKEKTAADAAKKGERLCQCCSHHMPRGAATATGDPPNMRRALHRPLKPGGWGGGGVRRSHRRRVSPRNFPRDLNAA